MNTWLFWGLAAAAVLSAVLVVGLRHAVQSVAALVVLSAALAGLCLLLAAPVAAAAILTAYVAGALVLFLPPLLFERSPDDANRGRLATPSIVRVFGLTVAVVLVLELGWAFRRTQGAGLPARSDTVLASVASVAGAVVTDHLATFGSAALLVAVSVVGVSVIRREGR